MNENKHTPEPWRVEVGEQPESIAVLCTSGLAHFEIVSDSQLGDIHADARRIVACVNACEDILDYELSLGCVARLSEQLRNTTKQRDELLSDIAKESAERDAVNTIAKRQSAILTRTGDELADCRTEIAALKAERDELLAELQRFMDSHEECTDFDGFTAQIVSMADYHQAQEAIARAKGEQ